MTLGIFTRNLRARSDALGINIEGNRELVGLFKLARARILQHATSDWPDLVPGLVDDMEEAIRQLPKGMTLAKQYPEVFDEVTHAPAVVPQVIPSLPIPSPSAVPPPSCLPSSGSGAVVSVPPARGDRHINLGRGLFALPVRIAATRRAGAIVLPLPRVRGISLWVGELATNAGNIEGGASTGPVLKDLVLPV
ncbi:hypothetical protein BJV77DRAFT_794701 [Russula vinacea]|nr:hypothetical protein BJV77DRAFT_794701 [Russula vinacea]